jgi:hypothetical protein
MTTSTPSMYLVKYLQFKNEIRRITFDKNGFPLNYHSIFGNRWQHLQDMLRLPDLNGRQYYMGAFSQNCSDNEGGMVFVGEVISGNSGKVIWMDELNNRHPAGGYNHPGDLRRIGNVVVIAGQNWDGGGIKTNSVEGFFKSVGSKVGQGVADGMDRGNGNPQNVLFYDVSDPSRPVYMGKINSCWKGNEKYRSPGDIDTLSAAKSGEYYYLSFNGIKCRSKFFTPDARWELIEIGDDSGSVPAFFSYNGVNYVGGARVDNGTNVVYEKLQFSPEQSLLTDQTNKVSRVDITTSVIPKHSFPSGATFSLSSFEDEKSYMVITNVESDNQIEIEEIESVDLVLPITDLYIAYGRNAVAPAGYTMISADLNRDAGGSDIHLWYTRDQSKGSPVTSITIGINTGNNVPVNYAPVPNNISNGQSDLNKGAGGADIFMFYSRNQGYGNPIVAIDILIGKNAQAPALWEKLNEDLNSGAGGNFLYLAYSR